MFPIFKRDWFNLRHRPFDPPADLKLGALDRLDGRGTARHFGGYDYPRDVMYGDLEDAGLAMSAGRHKAVSA